MLQDYTNFLANLAANNNKDWFDIHRSEYKVLKTEFEIFVGDLIPKIAEFDSRLKYLTPKDCTYRINRDVRFSNDKAPYKTHLSAAFGHAGKNGSAPGYYFELGSNGQIMIGGGWYMIDSPILFKLRTQISENPKTFLQIIQNRDFKMAFEGLNGEQLKTKPKGFDANNPAIDLLRYKNYLASYRSSIVHQTDHEIASEIIKSFKIISPLIKYLRENS